MFKLRLSFNQGSKAMKIDCGKEYTGTTHAIKRGKEALKSFGVDTATLQVVNGSTNEIVKQLSFGKGVWKVEK